MSLRVVIFRVIGFAGAASIAVGIHDIIRSADCASAADSCAAGVGGSVGLLVGGILAGVVGTIGGGFAVFFGMFAAIGLGAVLAGLQSSGFGHGFGLLFGGIFLASSLVPGGLLLAGSAGRRGRTRLLAAGSRGTATVLDVQDTGATINDNPVLRLRLLVTPVDESPPFEATLTGTVSRIDVPRRGERRAVIFDPADRGRVVWDPAAPPALQPAEPAVLEAARDGPGLRHPTGPEHAGRRTGGRRTGRWAAGPAGAPGPAAGLRCRDAGGVHPVEGPAAGRVRSWIRRRCSRRRSPAPSRS